MRKALLTLALLACSASGYAQTTIVCGSFPCPVNLPGPGMYQAVLATPTPTPVPPTPTATPTPTGLPVTITILSPTNGATVPAGTLLADNDSIAQCSGAAWYDECWLNGTHYTDAGFGQCKVTTSGAYQVKAHTSNNLPNPRDCAQSKVVSLTVGIAPTPIPTNSATPQPTATATPIPASHFSNMPVSASLPSEAQCAAAVDASALPENAPWNSNDGTGYDSNAAIAPPGYFYQHAGEQLGYPNADFQAVDGAYSGTTDDIIRVYSCKWGEDENWMRAQSMIESGWHQDCAQMHGGSSCHENGDNGNSDGTCSGLPASISAFGYPVTNSAGQYVFAQSFGLGSWNSWGIIQSKSGCAEWYTQPMLALSTSFGEDYKGAKWRSCVNGDDTARFGTSGGYAQDVSAAKSNPNSPYSAGETKYYSSNETNFQHLAMGCVLTHYSGGWYDSQFAVYATEFMNALNGHTWPGGVF